MSITFDMYGNIIPSKVKMKQKLTDEQKEIIKKIKEQYKIDIESEMRTYYCKIHNTFHKYLYGKKPSKTYLKCLKSMILNNTLRFKDDYTQSELFKMSFSKNWNQDKANYYKKVK